MLTPSLTVARQREQTRRPPPTSPPADGSEHPPTIAPGISERDSLP